MLKWEEPAAFVKGATASVRKAWNALGISAVGDLLLALPRRYDDFSQIRSISEANPGEVVTVKGAVVRCNKTSSFRKRLSIIRLVLKDATGSISATFFNQPWILEELTPGREIFLSGKINIHERYGKTISHPLWEPAETDTLAAGKIAPVYGLSGTLAQKTYRRLMHEALTSFVWNEDHLPEQTRQRYHLLSFQGAIKALHEPENIDQAEDGRRRLAFEEFLILQLGLAKLRREGTELGAPSVAFDEAYAKRFVANLPYSLTGDQKRAAWIIFKDLQEPKPMRRLLQGDVGSGKTVVAAFASAMVQRQGFSAAILAPTDILAKQHAVTLQRLLAHDQIPFLLVTRTDKRLYEGRNEQVLKPEELEKRVEQGNLILVGTHALLEEHRLPGDLAFAVIDEQHRFGVVQREALVKNVRRDEKLPHLLSMTATPIPRSLALTLYGDLDVSLVREKPEGRKPIATQVLVGSKREAAYEAIREAVKRGERAYVVCPLIDASDALGVASATEEKKRLSAEHLTGIEIGLVHGRLKAKEKEEVMTNFSSGKTPVLVATTVIEVGVDVPEATVIAIEGAERFGLAQLHQLRGRVGRSSKPSCCYLLTDMEGESLERIRVLEQMQDGFTLAEEDLRRRGAGRMFSTEQSGFGEFIAGRWSDISLMTEAKEAAENLLETNPKIKETDWPTAKPLGPVTRHLE